MSKSDKLRAIQAAVTSIEKQFGKGAIQVEGSPPADIPVIPTGSLGLDLALGVGGLPRGRVCEFFGPEHHAKRTLALHLLAECQKAGGVVAYIDAANALDVSYAKVCGVDPGHLLVSQPDCGEQALEIADQLCRTGAVDLIAVDDTTDLTPRAEVEGEHPEMDLRARLMSQALRKLTAVCAKQNTTVVFLTTLERPKFGEVLPGNNALKFYASVRLDVRVVLGTEDKGPYVGHVVRVKVIKNKVAAPFREAEFTILLGKGIDAAGEAFDVAVQHGVVEKPKSYYLFGEQPLGTTRDESVEYLREHSFVLRDLRQRVLDGMRDKRATEET